MDDIQGLMWITQVKLRSCTLSFTLDSDAKLNAHKPSRSSFFKITNIGYPVRIVLGSRIKQAEYNAAITSLEWSGFWCKSDTNILGEIVPRDKFKDKCDNDVPLSNLVISLSSTFHL